MFNMLRESLATHAGIELALGKTRAWNKGGIAPPDLVDLEQAAVQAGEEPVWNPRGVMVLGTPVGHPDYVREKLEAKLQEQQQLLDEVKLLPDLQCA